MEPTEHSKSRAQFQAQAKNYGKSHILADTSDVETLLESVDQPDPGSPALDIATGGGHCALALARFGFAPTVCDLTPAMVEQSRAQLIEHGFAEPGTPRTDAICPAESLPYPDEAFELVACRVAAHHFADPATFVREAARVLKSGSYFLLIDGSLPDDAPDTAAWLNQVERLRDPSHARLLDRREWIALVEAAGLRVELAELSPLSMPDLNWYFDTANTTPENRKAVRELVATADESIRAAMDLREQDDGVSWTWQRLGLLARRA